MNKPSTHKALLIIADISGYTRLMVSSDIEIMHSQHIISELIQSITKEVKNSARSIKARGRCDISACKKRQRKIYY